MSDHAGVDGPEGAGPPEDVAVAGTTGLVPLERRVLRLWRIRAALVVVPLALAAGAVGALAVGGSAGVGIGVAAALVGGAVAVGWTTLVWGAWRFRVGAEALELRHGVWTRVESTIPYHRVQHIDLEAGPLERRLGLTSLVLRTASASSDSVVPGIDAGHAEALRTRILALVGEGEGV